jgi:hypothetical protein
VELKAIEISKHRGRPLGHASWAAKTVAKLGTLRGTLVLIDVGRRLG